MILLNVIILHNVPQDNEAAHMRVQLQEVVTLPSPLDHICSCEQLSNFFPYANNLVSFMNQLTLILIHPGNYVSSLSKFCPYHFIYFFSIPSACSGRFVPVVYDERYLCHLYEARAMNYSSSEKECLNMGADLVEDPSTDLMKIQILVRLTGLFLNSTLLILMI